MDRIETTNVLHLGGNWEEDLRVRCIFTSVSQFDEDTFMVRVGEGAEGMRLSLRDIRAILSFGQDEFARMSPTQPKDGNDE